MFMDDLSLRDLTVESRHDGKAKDQYLGSR